MKELRCENKLHGYLNEDFVEVKCKSRFCGAKAGTVVIHRFDRETGKLMETMRFKDPRKGD